ncbi:hypothetical protein Stube_04680 [Streptomyces tubercidicus]|uniref:Uncharacterized protein n=1 Tax=Streptomyces tubercidicus TaxID=47759 RepID=A0A640UNC6_9ACTN|nr:hypothetical protein Stube_04680 [Streptomyces tubercidicus]
MSGRFNDQPKAVSLPLHAELPECGALGLDELVAAARSARCPRYWNRTESAAPANVPRIAITDCHVKRNLQNPALSTSVGGVGADGGSLGGRRA